MNSPRNDGDPVKEIAGVMRLKEGEEAVRRVLTQIFRAGKIGTKDLAKAARLPIPVTAAIRRELEKAGLVARRGGAILTEKGSEYVTQTLGVTLGSQETETEIDQDLEVLENLRKYSLKRPPASPELDQAHATPETALKRVQYMQRRGDLDGRRLLFLGDDDLTSVAAGFLGTPREIGVIDVDERLLELIGEASKTEGLGIECVHHDLRDPLPESMLGRFDVFFTDPPYTVNGVKLFLSRGLQALRPRKVSNIYVAYADKPPLEMLELHRAITDMGMYISELTPGFNTYEGAEIFANTTSQMRLTVTARSKPTITGTYSSHIYTGEAQPRMRVYRCKCGADVLVGPKQRFSSINELKTIGCPHCGARAGFTLKKRVNL